MSASSAGVTPAGVDPAGVDPAGVDPTDVDPTDVDPADVTAVGVDPAVMSLAGMDPAGTNSASTARASSAEQPTDPRADEVIGTLVLPTGTVPLHAARLDADGIPVPPTPGTAALLDEGGAQLLLLPAVEAIPLDEGITLTVDGEDPQERTIVEAQNLTPAELAEHVRTLPAGEQQIAAPAPDGTWTVAELE